LADFEGKDLTCSDLPNLVNLGALSFPQEFNYFKFVFELVVGDRAHEFWSGGWISKIEKAK
jgi:hypothetical protein